MRKKISVLIAVLILVILFAGCSSSGETSVLDPATTQVAYDLSVVVTVGNRSYIPLNIIEEYPGDNPSQMLLILKAFEDSHPAMEIVDWKIEKRQRARGIYPKIYGIWVDHKLRN